MKDREMFSECQGGEMLRGGAGSRGKMAADKFLAGYNCAQAVAVAFRDVTGLGERDTARMVSAFGGGMGRMREVCGAVSGMLFVLSWLYGYDQPGDDESKKVLYTRVQALAGEFRGRTGSVICRELLENPASDPNPTPRTADFYAERPCARFVYQAADILEKFIEENPVHG